MTSAAASASPVRGVRLLLSALFLSAPACGAGDREDRAAGSAVSATPVDPWVVRLDGIGPILYGMAVADARAALGDTLSDPTPADKCVYVVPANVPIGLRLMVENGRVVRVDVDSAGILTEAGGEVGMREAGLRARYPSGFEMRPHKYDTAARYLIYKDQADSSRRLVFETDRQRVLRYRAGIMPAVEYVEGCG